jgi:tRNA(Ile)-lysidine synthase
MNARVVETTSERVWQRIRSAGLLRSGQRVLVACSGGADSTAMLDLLRRLAPRGGWTPVVVTIDHHQQPRHTAAVRQLRNRCRRWSLQFVASALAPEQAAPGSDEDRLRRARYRLLRRVAADQGCQRVATGHTADDQVETVLLRLLRGAGPTGLAGMAGLRPLPPGFLARPLLRCTRADILAYLEARGIEPVDDPSNRDPSFDRNYLRHRVLPTVAGRWPGYRSAVLRAADWQRSAAAAVDARARSDWQRTWTAAASGEALLALSQWLALEPNRACAVIRHWCSLHGLPEPPAPRLRDFRRQCLEARSDRQPLLDWPAAQLRAHRNALWLDRKPLPPDDWQLDWSPRAPAPLPAGGSLVLQGPRPRGLDGAWQLGPAPAGARLRPREGGRGRRVGELMREAGIPPWRRPALPALTIDGRLAAVATDWLDAAFSRQLSAAGARLEWRGRPRALLPSRPNCQDSPP